MPVLAAGSEARLLAGLIADIVREATAAERYLCLAQFMDRQDTICRQVAACAAAALSNATVLAAEVLGLGGAPPCSPLGRPGAPPAAATVEEHLIDARADVAHFQGRLECARRLGLLRLEQVLHEIVLAKTRHLAHAQVIAPAWAACRGAEINREKTNANRSTNKRRHEHF